MATVSERARELSKALDIMCPQTKCATCESRVAGIEQALLAERRLAMETAIKEICLPDVGKVHDCSYPIDFSNGYHAGIQHALRQVRAVAEKEVGTK